MISNNSINDIYLKLIVMSFDLQDPHDKTIENAIRDVDIVLSELEVLLNKHKKDGEKSIGNKR